MKTTRILVTFVVLMFAGSAYADGISLTPADCNTTMPGGNCWVIPDDPTPGAPVANPDADEVEAIVGSSTDLTELYKADVGNEELPATTEGGSFADDYTTEFFNTEFDPADATISWDGPDTINCITEKCYLLVKDGNHDPNVYIFDISGWDGQEHIHLTGFWPDGGAISHVAIFGGTRTNVPEPGTLALLGLGLFGMGMMRRKELLEQK